MKKDNKLENNLKCNENINENYNISLDIMKKNIILNNNDKKLDDKNNKVDYK